MTRAGQAGIPGERRARKLHGQWVPRFRHMLVSPAWRALSLAARRCLERIEIEHMQQGGKENGQLAVTYDHFVEYGIDRHAIAPAQRQLEALGFVEITEHGVAGNADHRSPNKFRLTHIHAGRAMATNEWSRIKTMEEARAIAKAARLPREESRKWRVQKQKPVGVFPMLQCGDSTLKAAQTGLRWRQSPVGETHTTSIFLGGTAGDAGETLTASSLPSSSLPSRVGSKSAKKSRAKKLPWSTPTLTEIYPGPATIDRLKALYKHQAEQDGQPDDVWIPPPSPSKRYAREMSNDRTTNDPNTLRPDAGIQKENYRMANPMLDASLGGAGDE
jgi:hypothetical protein